MARSAACGNGGFTECNVRENAQRGINNGRYWAWFVGRNRGEPFNSDLRDELPESDVLYGESPDY